MSGGGEGILAVGGDRTYLVFGRNVPWSSLRFVHEVPKFQIFSDF
jgi:hypothetical protein